MLSPAENTLLTQTGPGTPMGEVFRRFWLPALFVEELPEPDGAPIRFRVLSEDLVAFRDSNGAIAFMQQACPHRGASMFFGRNEESGLRCVYHGWKFDVAGDCVDMPNEPAESNFKHKIKARTYPGAEWGGLVWIYMGPPELQTELPRLEFCLLPPEHVRLNKWQQRGNYAQGLEGNLDSAHISYLHRTFDRPGVTPQNRRAGRSDRAPQLSVKETEFGFMYGARRNDADGNFYWRLTPFMFPTYTSIPQPWWPTTTHMLVPVDDEHVWWFVAYYNPFEPFPATEPKLNRMAEGWIIPGTFSSYPSPENDFTINREKQRTVNYSGIDAIRVQDMAMTETMAPVLNRTIEHLGTTDLAIIMMRRMLMKLAHDLQAGREPFATRNPGAYTVRPFDGVDAEGDLGRVMDAHHAEIVRG
jgi:phenylpropionate dioxygenase-like ring-hydroxylating dioxygenase large terminal subunit